MTPRGWQAVVINRAGEPRQYVNPRELRLTERLNGHVVASCVVNLREGDTSELMVGRRGLRLLREGAVRFQGPIVSPLRYFASPSVTNVSLTAWSPLGVLNRRYLHASEVTRYDQVDAGAIAGALVTIANNQEETHLRMGTVQASMDRDREYDIGKNIGEAVDQLAYVRNGFYYKDRPVTGEGAKWSALDILHPSPGVERPAALFSFGEGTRDSVEEFEVEYDLPVNDVIAIGQIDTETQIPLVAEDEDSVSFTEYGLWGASVSYPDVTQPSTLADHAAASLDPEPPTIYKVRPLPTSTIESGRSPRLWEDFDVGDTVFLTLRANAPYDVEGQPVRVLSATVAVSDDALTERLEEITLEVVS